MYQRKLGSVLFLLLFCIVILTGCAFVGAELNVGRVPSVAALDPIYELPTLSLAEKEALLSDAVVERHLNEQGYLLYQSYLPFSDLGNYQQSHNSADLPAWHGHWMATLAMKLAVAPSPDVEVLLLRAIEGLRTNFEATGVTGLLGRAYLKHEGEERLPWMVTEDQRPTRFWQRGENGFWFRNGVAKGHYAAAVFGLATVIGLENRGAISLSPETSSLVRQTLIEIAHYLIDNYYRIVDANGNVTEFGRLTWKNNGFNALQLIAMLRAGKAIGDEKCADEYQRMLSSGVGRIIRNTLGVMGDTYSLLGRERAFNHFSDDQAIYTNAFTLFLNSDEGDEEILRHIKFALRRMWQYLRYSRKSYITFIHTVMVEEVFPDEREQALETLRMFPDDKRIISGLKLKDTRRVQPIANQSMNSHYWKTDYFRKARLTSASERMNVEYSGQDYLFVYWMGRYFGLISEEEATAPVIW